MAINQFNNGDKVRLFIQNPKSPWWGKLAPHKSGFEYLGIVHKRDNGDYVGQTKNDEFEGYNITTHCHLWDKIEKL